MANRFQVATFAFIGALALSVVSAANARPKDAVDLTIKSKKIGSFVRIGFDKKVFGKLKFLGGLELDSSNPDFGGISSLHVNSDQSKLTAITDEGNWIIADLVRKNGVISGLANALITPILSRGGKPHDSKWNADAEGLEISGNTAFISFERNHRIERYSLDKNGFAGAATSTGSNFRDRDIPSNKGIEAIALAPESSPIKNHMIAFPEGLKSGKSRYRGFLMRRGKVDKLKIKRKSDFRITDATFLPDGDLLVLERLFDPPLGVRMRIQRIDGNTIKKRAKLKGTELINVGLSHQIDNMEGIAVSKNTEGETIISVISDNNFNKKVQRTLYLEFKLLD